MIERSEKMRNSKRVVLYISIMVLSIFIIGCDRSSDITENQREDSKEEQIKNLEDLYDKEGYRDGEF